MGSPITDEERQKLRSEGNYCGFSDGSVYDCDERESGCSYCMALYYEN